MENNKDNDLKEAMDFFSSLDEMNITTSNVNQQELFDKLKNSILTVLAFEFPTTPAKKKIVGHSTRLNFACPYCGDSATDDGKKRGNFYTTGLWYKCYNCGKVTPIYKFIEHFKQEENYSFDELAFLKTNLITDEIKIGGSSSTKLADIFGIEQYAIPRSEIMKKMSLVEINNNKRIYDYLSDRKQIMKNRDCNDFAYDRQNDILYVFNLTSNRNNIIGLQGRFLDKKMIFKLKRRFDSFDYSQIWHKIFEQEVSEEIVKKINKFSLIYNILNVNFAKDVFVFEGAIDARHMQNSIASLSAEDKIKLPKAKYFTDSTIIDKTGIKNAIDLIQQEEYVFLWRKFVDDYPMYRFCKDLNDIYKKQYIDENILKTYFSNDPMDMINL